MKKIFIAVFISILLVSFTDPYTIKRVSDKDYRYEFYTTEKTNTIKNTKNYYWFKGGLIHSSQGGEAGQLLHDNFKKFYHSNQLAEQGRFKKGLKVGLWKTWFQNGTLETTQEFSNGFLSGNFQKFDAKGNLIEKGKFQQGKKQGKWINYISKDTIQFKQGKIFVPKPKLTKEEKILAKEAKLKEKEVLKLQKEKEKEIKKANKENPQVKKGKSKTTPKEKNKKENFFTSLFSKKEK